MKNILKTQLNKETENKILNFFSSLADETRLQILISIAEKPKNVNEIYEFVGKEKMTLSAISHQLNNMKNLNIVSSVKHGKEKSYELSDSFCWCILRDAFKQFNNDLHIRCKKCEKIRGGGKN